MTSTCAWSPRVGSSSVEHLVEGAGLLVAVADRLVDLDAALAGDLDGAVGAVVGDHDDAVRRPGLVAQRVERRADRGLLVVGRQQRDERTHGPHGALADGAGDSTALAPRRAVAVVVPPVFT